MKLDLGHISELTPSMLKNHGLTRFTWTHDEHYLDGDTSRELEVLLYVDELGACTAISDKPFSDHEVSDRQQLASVASETGIQLINLDQPLPLTPINIAKPWGQEIWYSGIESRGVSLVNGTPISWLLDIFGAYLGCLGSPLLLKILDPTPAENLGDLYFEMHEEKIEVYVVTSIDTDAWPDGTGAIRYGFNQEKVSVYESRQAFLDAYLQQVTRYRACRNEIDERFNEGQDYQALLDSLPEELVKREQHLRTSMYEFTELKPLRQGDVVTVRPLVPHSLQHGVRVVEFQTPHYERYILSFGQKVLTQDHWDTEQVLEKANTDPVEFDKPQKLSENQDLIADFDEFRVTRFQLAPGDTMEFDSRRYAMLMGIQGTTNVSGTPLAPEAAVLLPQKKRVSLSNPTESPVIFLVAEEATESA